jgi:Arc/MetJ-type ribon-helix-helix transcriptional regulator
VSKRVGSLYCGCIRVDPQVFQEVIRELLKLLERQYGNIATVTPRKLKLYASLSEVGRALRLLRDMGILEPAGERSYTIHKKMKGKLIQLLESLRVETSDLNQQQVRTPQLLSQ